MLVTIVVPGEPIAQPRAKATAFGGRARMYTPTRNGIATYKALIAMAATDAYDGPPLSGALRIDCVFVFSRPKGHYGSGRNSNRLKDSAPHWHTSKPDRDNLDKAVLDGLKGIIVDDKSVCVGLIEKRYALHGEHPHTTIEITELEN